MSQAPKGYVRVAALASYVECPNCDQVLYPATGPTRQHMHKRYLTCVNQGCEFHGDKYEVPSVQLIVFESEATA